VAPGYVRDLHEYLEWLQDQIEQSGGTLVDDHLIYRFPVGDDPAWPSRVFIAPHVLDFPIAEVRLWFRLTVTDELELPYYSFDFRHHSGLLIFRKDRHVGHEREVGGMSHLHRDPHDEENVEDFPEVDFDEVMYEVHLYFSTHQVRDSTGT
jgi:hypothetical protein